MPICAALAFSTLATMQAAAVSRDEPAILALETRRYAAMIAADLPVLDTILADDLSYAHSSGRVDTKAELLEALRTGRLKYKSIDRTDVRVKFYGDTALVTGEARVRIEADGKEQNLALRFLDVYVKSGGTWRMVAWQSARLPPQP